MDSSKILLTGGTGLLGTELRRLAPDLLAPPHRELDVLDRDALRAFFSAHNVQVVIHAAAFTSPPKVDQDPIAALKTNVVGTTNLVEVCSEYAARLVYISTDYVFRGDKGYYREGDELLPQNKYAWSKLGGECAVRMSDHALIIRTSFCEPVFPFEKAFVDQYTSRDSVQVIAPMILALAGRQDLTGVIHVGTERKSVKDLAIKLGKADVDDLYRNEVTFDVPYDTSFDLTKLLNIKTSEESS